MHCPGGYKSQISSISQEAVRVKRFCKLRWWGNSRDPTHEMETCPQRDDHPISPSFHPTPGSPPQLHQPLCNLGIKLTLYHFTKFFTLIYYTWSSKSISTTFLKGYVIWSQNYWLMFLPLWWYVGLLLIPIFFLLPQHLHSQSSSSWFGSVAWVLTCGLKGPRFISNHVPTFQALSPVGGQQKAGDQRFSLAIDISFSLFLSPLSLKSLKTYFIKIVLKK